MDCRRKKLIEWKCLRLLTNSRCCNVLVLPECKSVSIATVGILDVRLPSLCHSVRYPWYIQNVLRNLRHTCSMFLLE